MEGENQKKVDKFDSNENQGSCTYIIAIFSSAIILFFLIDIIGKLEYIIEFLTNK